MDKTLLIIGAGAEQIPAYEKAKKRGLRIVTTDGNPHAPAVPYADFFLEASTRDPEATLQVALEFNQNHQIDGVMTIANDVPLTVATVANALGLPSISIPAAQAASNKLLMKDLLRENRVACPWHQVIETLTDLEKIIIGSGQRFVIKPIDGRGARGVLLIDKQTNLDWAFNESKRWGDSGKIMIEEYVPGIQLSTESFILNKKCYTAAYCERNYSRLEEFKPYIIEDGGTIPSVLSDEMKDEIDALILSGSSAMGINEGIVKGDLVIDPQGTPRIIELAARLSGGWFASHQIPAATGVDLVDVVISFALGLPIYEQDLIPTKTNSTAIRYWFPKPGRITKIEGESKLKDLPFLLDYGFFKRVGDVQNKVKMHPDRFGFAIVTGKDRDESLRNIQIALDTVTIETTA